MPLIAERAGNVFESDMTVILHQANCFNVMGTGFAEELKMRYPEAFVADRDFPIRIGSRDRLGKHSFAWSRDNKRLLVNLYGQYRYGRDKKYTDEDALLQAMESVFLKLIQLKERRPDFTIRVGIPMFIGCGLAGGDWSVVYPRIESLADKYDFPVYMYQKR